MDIYTAIEIGAAIGMGVAIVSAFREHRNQQEEIIELLWKLNTQMARMTGDQEVFNGIRARSGRILQPRTTRNES